MRLAIFLDPVSKGTHPPILDFFDLAAKGFDHRLELRRERLHLLTGNILSGQKNMLVERHGTAFPAPYSAFPALSPSSPESLVAANEGGDTGKRTAKVLPFEKGSR